MKIKKSILFEKKIILSLFLLFSLVFLINFVQANQVKMAVKECLMSYNDANFGAWDATNHRGVFIKVINNNQNLGTNQYADYNYTNYNVNLPGTTIPMLKIEPGKPNLLYTKCNFKVGNYRIFVYEYNFPYGGDIWGLHFTTDFGLNGSVGIEPGYIKSYNTSVVYPRLGGANYNGAISNYNQYRYNLKRSAPAIYYADNKVHSGYENDSGVNKAANIVLSEGFYPNTEPVIITKQNFTKFPSGVFEAYSLIRESGRVSLIDYIWDIFYLNSTTADIKDFLVPVPIGGRVTNLDTPNINGNYTINTLQCTQIAKNCFNLSNGGRFNFTIYFSNIYNESTKEINYTFRPRPDDLGYARFRTYGEVGGKWLGPTTTGTVPEIPAYSIFNYTYLLTIPANESYIWPYYWVHVYPSDAASQVLYLRIGGDDVDYLRFSNYDPRIEMKLVGQIYTPVFNFTVSVFPEPYGATNYWNYRQNVIFPGDYNLSFEVWNGTLGSSSIKDSYNITLGQSFFNGLGLTNISSGQTVTYSYNIPIKDEYLAESIQGTKYYIYTYSIPNNGKFIGKKIATPMVTPHFTPGDIAYNLNNRLYFSLDSKIDSEEIIIFNPSFYPTTMNLSVKNWSNNQNFTISWDGINFGKDLVRSIDLGPLESRKITFLVNATHNPWITANRVENLEINISADIYNGATTVKKIKVFNYILNLSKDNLDWFDLSSREIFPDSVDIPYGTNSKTESINLNWQVLGGATRISSNYLKGYKVNLTLTDKLGNTLNNTLGNFIINGSGIKSFSIGYNFTQGKYYIKVKLDYENNLSENLQDLSSGELNNEESFTFNANPYGCHYNATDHYLYLAQYGFSIKQTNCNINCCPTGTSCVLGFCADNLGNCSYSNLSDCNSMPWVHTAGDWCGWKCSNAFCPPPAEPGYENYGSCLNCVRDILDSCSGYNNNITCNADPCKKAEQYEVELHEDINASLYFGCNWVYGLTNRCAFNYTNVNGTNCVYVTEIVDKCDVEGVLTLVSTDINRNCLNSSKIISCEDIVKLNFFNFWSLLASVLIIVIIYVLIIKKKLKFK